MKKVILCFGFVFTISILSAQVDSIRNEILNYQNDDAEIISKARRMLMDKLMIDDYQKIKEIKDFLIKEVENKNYLALYIPEQWLILYWTQEFEELLTSIEQVGYNADAKNISTLNNRMKPNEDKLFDKLRDKSISSRHLLDIIIENASIKQEEKEFLELHLNYCLSDYDYNSTNQELLNEQSDKFLLKYPTSPYAPFIKKVIRYKEKVSNFGWGYDISMGYCGFEGGISNSFSDYFAFGMSFDFVYTNIVLNVGFSMGGATLNKDIEFQSVIWSKDKKGDVIIPQASLGYTLFGSRRISITPFVGISGVYISPKWDDVRSNTLLEDVELTANAAWNIGFSINLFSKAFTTPRHLHKMSQMQGFIKLKYNYINSGFTEEYYGLDGAIHNVTLALGGFARRVKRSW